MTNESCKPANVPAALVHPDAWRIEWTNYSGPPSRPVRVFCQMSVGDGVFWGRYNLGTSATDEDALNHLLSSLLPGAKLTLQ